MNFYIGLDVMVIKLWPLGSKLTVLYFALWGWVFTDHISPWSAFSLLVFIDKNARDWKERQKIDFFFLVWFLFVSAQLQIPPSTLAATIESKSSSWLWFSCPPTPPIFRTTLINSPHRHQQYSLGLLKPLLKDLILLGERGVPQTFWVWESAMTFSLLRALSPRWTGTSPSF